MGLRVRKLWQLAYYSIEHRKDSNLKSKPCDKRGKRKRLPMMLTSLLYNFSKSVVDWVAVCKSLRKIHLENLGYSVSFRMWAFDMRNTLENFVLSWVTVYSPAVILILFLLSFAARICSLIIWVRAVEGPFGACCCFNPARVAFCKLVFCGRGNPKRWSDACFWWVKASRSRSEALLFWNWPSCSAAPFSRRSTAGISSSSSWRWSVVWGKHVAVYVR